MKVKIFGKKGCVKCETTKNKFSHFLTKNNRLDSVALEFHDMDTVDGLAEGAYYDVSKVPTTVIERGNDPLARWNGDVPKTEEFRPHFLDDNR